MTRRRRIELAVVLLLVAGIAGVAGFWDARRVVPRRGFAVNQAAVPAPAPDFTANDLAGRPVSLEGLRGRVVLLNFWATWCAPCREEFPAMETVSRDFGPRGLVVVAVNYREARELVAGFTRDQGATFPVVLDPEGTIAERYRVMGLPATFLIDRDGRLVGTVLGYRAWAGPEARAYLEDLLAARAS